MAASLCHSLVRHTFIELLLKRRLQAEIALFLVALADI